MEKNPKYWDRGNLRHVLHLLVVGKDLKTVKTVVWNNEFLSVEHIAFACGEWKEILVQLERLKELAKNQGHRNCKIEGMESS